MEWTLYASAVFLAVYLVALTVRRLRFRRDRARMTREARAGGKVVAGVEEMPAGTVKKFWLICGKFRVDCFLINHQGRRDTDGMPMAVIDHQSQVQELPAER